MINKRMWGLAVGLGAVVLIATAPSAPVASAESIFEHVQYGPSSIGGRATYYDPKDADARQLLQTIQRVARTRHVRT